MINDKSQGNVATRSRFDLRICNGYFTVNLLLSLGKQFLNRSTFGEVRPTVRIQWFLFDLRCVSQLLKRCMSNGIIIDFNWSSCIAPNRAKPI